jgi:type IV pilus assembly protein PilY1
VDLGEIEGGREIVFFIVTYYDSRQYPDGVLDSHVLPCLKQDTAGKCLLHFQAPIHVFFSKAMWNMDQNSSDNPVVAERNIGCGYDPGCNRANPDATPAYSCPVGGTGPRLCGWLDGPKTQEGSTLHRLLTVPAYGNLDMPMERVIVPRPTGPLAYRNPMPHVIVGAPTTDPFRWILGFEDVPGGGDRDFNDLVFVINKQNGGGTRSATVSGDISPSIAEDFTITKVRFSRQDDFAPAPRVCGRTHCWTEETPGACRVNGAPEPTITYSLAVDCRLCANGTCTRNPNPTWFPVEFPEDDPQNVELDILALGFTGSQLCWKVDVSSPNERCRPVIDNINVGYQAVRAGAYARASPATLGNTLIYGVNETPGRAWGQNWPGSGMPAAGVRAYDERKDFSVRGRLYLRSLYDPESPDTTRVVQRWDAGHTLADRFRTDDLQPQDRKLYTMSSSGQRTDVSAEAEPGDNDSPLFPDRLCDIGSGRRWRYDLNRDGKCGTPSIDSEEKHVEGVDSDRHFFVQWLYGWEDRHAPGRENVKRPWPMGGINLSTVALAVPPYLDSWSQNALPGERDLYRKNFMDPLKERSTIGYVGTMNGFLHAFDSGEFRNVPRDQCAGGNQLRGLFKVQGTACPNPAPRLYGTGAEKFAYLPRGMLERYRNLYVQYAGAPTPPSLDASPSIANVDFRIPNQPEWTIKTDAASKTEGAKTVLVTATGKKSPYVFSLDITDPTRPWYPLPLWEFNMVDSGIDWMFLESWLENVLAGVTWPDNSGSRHAPSVARLAWGPNADNAVWAAVVGTDYKPADLRAGALYLIDMKTGRPLNYGTSDRGRAAGIITLDYGFGVAAESALVDLNRDGSYDVIYVPTTAGNVYRINLDQVDTSDYMGRKVKKCKIVNTKAVLDVHPNAEPLQNNNFQQIFSNLAVKVVRDGAEPVVRFYYGTSDNPDEFSDGPANKASYKYHLLAFEDRNPKGVGNCQPLSPLWVHKLDAGQVVWGGVTLTGDKVFATTAVGQAADVCSLSDTTSGRLYESGQMPTNGNPPAISSRSLGGHGVTAPVVHDQHLFVLTATGEMKLSGSQRWNNGTANTGTTRTRVLIYDPNPEGGLPR